MSKTLRDALLPCPFCGEQANATGDWGWHWVRCSGCGVQTPSAALAAEAVTYWNRRAALAAEQAQPTDARLLELAEPFGAFEHGDAQGHKRIAFARAVLAAAPPPAPVAQPYASEIAKIIRHARAGNMDGVRSYALLLCDKMDAADPGSSKYLRRVVEGDDGELVHLAAPVAQTDSGENPPAEDYYANRERHSNEYQTGSAALSVVFCVGYDKGYTQARDDARWMASKQAAPVAQPTAQQSAIIAQQADVIAHLRDQLRQQTQGDCREDGMPASANERRLRRLLGAWSRIAHVYTDDGEWSGAEAGISIDFMRDPLDAIESKLSTIMLARVDAQQAVAPLSDSKRIELAREHRKNPPDWDTPTAHFQAGIDAAEKAHGIAAKGGSDATE